MDKIGNALNISSTNPLSQNIGGTGHNNPGKIQAPIDVVLKPPTQTILTSGSGTYTKPENCLYIHVELCGGGGGGSGGGSIGAGAGTAGTTTTFGSSFLTATGGASGGGAPGTGTGGSVNIPGQHGGPQAMGGVSATAGGFGGNTPFGGGGVGRVNQPPTPASGYGAGGGAGGATSLSNFGLGGSSAGYVRHLNTNPAASYPYSVGARGLGGAAGTGGTAGGNGVGGVIIITEYYS